MPLIRRRRPLLRAAALGGTYAYGKHRARAEDEAQQQAYYAGQQSAMAAPPPAAPGPAPGITAEDTGRLAELGKLHEQGILTDEEFSQQKAIILAGR